MNSRHIGNTIQDLWSERILQKIFLLFPCIVYLGLQTTHLESYFNSLEVSNILKLNFF